MRLSWWTRVRTWGLRHGGRETGVIDRIFEENLKLPGKLRLAAKHICERLRDEYDFLGGYTIVKEYVREHRCRTREMFVPLAHPPWHVQCDFDGALLVIGGVEQKAHCLILRRPKPGYHVLRRLDRRRARGSSGLNSLAPGSAPSRAAAARLGFMDQAQLPEG